MKLCTGCRCMKPEKAFRARTDRPSRESRCGECRRIARAACRALRPEPPGRNGTLTLFTPDQAALSSLLRAWGHPIQPGPLLLAI